MKNVKKFQKISINFNKFQFYYGEKKRTNEIHNIIFLNIIIYYFMQSHS